MDPATLAVIGGVGSDILGGLLGSSAQKKANATNIKLQRENQAWMERMSNTTWQRGTQDMLAAGMNPMLAYSQGGASTPSSSAATVNPVDALGKGVTSAGSKAMQAISLQQAMANIELTKNQAFKAKAEGDAASFHANPEIMGSTWDLNREEQRTRIKQMESAIAQAARQGELTNEQARQIRSMLPMLMDTARSESQLRRLQIPSAKAEAKFWEQGSSEVKWLGLLKQLLK